jgi:Flp pilus assembly protein TadD
MTRQLLTRGVEELQSSKPGAIERAGRLFELAREINYRDPRVLDGLGCYYFRKDEFELAKFYFQRALEIDPNYDRAVAHLAMVARQDGNIEAARELLRQAVAMNPLNYQERNNLVALGLEFGEIGGFDLLLTEREATKAQLTATVRKPALPQ